MLANYDKSSGKILFGGKNKNITDDVKIALEKLQPGMIATTTNTERLAKTLGTTDKGFINFCSSLKKGDIQLQQGQTYLQAYEAQLKSTGFSFKNIGASAKKFFGSLGTNLLNIGAGMAIGAGVSLVISGVSKLVDKLKELEEQKQKIHELGETARSEFQSIQDSLKSTVSRVNEVKDRYAELAQGVENLGKSNQSRGKLSTEDYEEFLSISNELSSLMPDLTKTYDDNGNAILNLNGDIQTITNSLNDFIEAQKRMAAQDMFTKMPDIYSDYRQTVSEYADKYNNSQDKANIYKDLIENNSIQNPLNFIDGDEIRKAFLSKGIDEDTVSQLVDWSNLYNIDDFDESTQQKIKSVFQDMYSKYAKEAKDYGNKIEQENKKLGLEITQTLYDNATYQDISKNDTTKKSIIDSLIPKLDYDTLTSGFGKDFSLMYSTLIEENIINAIDDIDDDSIKNALNEVLNNPDITIDDRAGFLQQIQGYFDNLYGENNVISLVFKPQIEEANAIQDSFNKVASRFKNSQKIKDFFDLEGINTQEEIDTFEKITDGITDADEAIKSWNKHLAESSNTDNTFDPSTAFDAMKAALEEQSKQGYLTDETLTKLKETYGELNDVISYTPNGIVLSTEAMMELTEQTSEAALVSTKMKKALAVKDYQKAAKTVQNHENKYKGLINAYKKGESSARKYLNTFKKLNNEEKDAIISDLNKAKSLGEQVKSYDALENKIRAATSALNIYKQATETPNNKDNFDYARSALSSAEEAFKQGWTGTDDYKTFIDYIGAYNKEMNNYTAPEEYFGRAKRYLTEDVTGVYNFLDDAVAKSSELEKSWVTKTDGHYKIAIDDITNFAKEMNMTTSFVTDMLLATSEAWDFNIDFTSFSDGLEDAIENIKELPKGSEEAAIALDDMAETIRKLEEAGYDVSELKEIFNDTFNEIASSTIELSIEISKKSITEVLKQASEVSQSVEEKSGIDINFSANTKGIDSQIRGLTNYRANLSIGTVGYDEATLVIGALIKQKQELEKPTIMTIDDSELSETGVIIKDLQSAVNEMELYEATLGVDSEQYVTAKTEVDNLYASLKKCKDFNTTGISDKLNFQVKGDVNSFNKTVKNLDVSKLSSDKKRTGKIFADDSPARKALNNFINFVRNSNVAINIRASLDDKFKPNLQKLIDNLGVFSIKVKPILSGLFGGTSESTQHSNNPNTDNNELIDEIVEEVKEVVEESTKINNDNNKNDSLNIVISNKNDGASGDGSERPNNGDDGGNTPPSSTPNDTTPKTEDSKSEETFDWIEVKIQRITEAIEKLTKVRDNSYISWSKRNQALADEMAKTEEAIKVQEEAYAGYMGAANAVGLDEQWAQKVRDGKIEIEKITDETLKKQIQEYQEWYNKMVECDLASQDLKITLSELAKTKFDSLISQFDGIISLIEGASNIADAKLKQLEAKGYFANEMYYQDQIKAENDRQNNLKLEYAGLMTTLNEAMTNGTIEEGSEAWNEMYAEIQRVAQEITESETRVIELNNAIRDLEWSKFDYAQDRISALTDETQFLIDLLGDDLFNDNGTFNNNGQTANGLHAIKYNIYTSQAQDYGDEIKKITAELARDPNNKTLIERREELLKLQQESIKNANAEKDAIKSLVQEGINQHLDGLSKTIDKYKEQIRVAKDLYDYQKNIANQTKTIADLEKIMAAYSGDDSEETRKIVQETQVKLQEAKDELKETEYERMIADTEDLLDNLYDEYSETLNSRLDDIDKLIADMIDQANKNAGNIQDTINKVAGEVGYDPTWALQALVGTGANGSDMVSTFDGHFKNIYTCTQMILDAIKRDIQDMGYDTANGDEDRGRIGFSYVSESKIGEKPNNQNNEIPIEGLVINSKTGNPEWRKMQAKDLTSILEELNLGIVPSYDKYITDFSRIVPKLSSDKSQNVNNTHIEVILPNAKDYDEFKRDFKNDPSMTKYIQQITVGESMGFGSLSKYKY